MIILLTGPTGVGKTDTSWALLEIAPPMVFLDCDWFAARAPFSWSLESDVDSVYEALSVMLDFHMRRGETRFVIPLALEMATSYAERRHYLERFRLPLFPYLLSCGADVLRERVLKRDRNPIQRTRELGVIPSQLRISQGLSRTFVPMDVSGMDEHALARKILGSIPGGGSQGAQQVER